MRLSIATETRWPGSLQRLVLRPVERVKTSMKAGQNTFRFFFQYLTVLLLCWVVERGPVTRTNQKTK